MEEGISQVEMGGIRTLWAKQIMCKSSGGESMAGMVWEVEGGEAEGLGHRGPLARSKSVPNSHSGQWRRLEELQGRKSHVQVSVLRKSYF